MNIIENKIYKACEIGDLDNVKELIKDVCSNFLMYGANPFAEKLLMSASLNGHLDIVKFFLSSDICNQYMKRTENIKSALEELLKCPKENTLPIISYLVNHPAPCVSYTFPSFVDEQINISVSNDNVPLFMALVNPHDPENNYLSIFGNFFFLKNIYSSQTINIAKCVLINSVFNDWNDRTKAFELACENNNDALLKFLIFDLDIPKTKDVSYFIMRYNNSYAEEMFNSRELNKSLQQSLKIINQTASKKIKL
jgi:hypothetical protein